MSKKTTITSANAILKNAQEVVIYNHRDPDRHIDCEASVDPNPTSANTSTDEAAAAAKAGVVLSNSKQTQWAWCFSKKNVVMCGVACAVVGVAGIVGAASGSASARSTQQQMQKSYAEAIMGKGQGGDGKRKPGENKGPDFSWVEGFYTSVDGSGISREDNVKMSSGILDDDVLGANLGPYAKLKIQRAPRPPNDERSVPIFEAKLRLEYGLLTYYLAGVSSYNPKGDNEITLYGDFFKTNPTFFEGTETNLGSTNGLLSALKSSDDEDDDLAPPLHQYSDVATLKLTKLSSKAGKTIVAADFYDNIEGGLVTGNHFEAIFSFVFEKEDDVGIPTYSPTSSTKNFGAEDGGRSLGALRCKSNLGPNSPTADVGSTLKQVNQEGEDELLVSCLSDESSIRKESISTGCENEMYDVAVSVVPGPHFFLLATKSPDSSSNVICPTTLAFDTLNFEKKIAAPYEEDFKALPSYELKTAVKLTDLLEAEESAESHDASNFDVLTNNCVHYASKIWRPLGVHETEDLADFIVTNIISDEKEDEGVRRLAWKAPLVQAMKEGKVKKIVYSQLHLNQ